MKKSVLLVLLMSCFTFYGQNANFEEELRRVVKVPGTPEAAAFESYGAIPVNMYTGAPNISIPLYTIAGQELSLPISLSYDASGVKVRQMATGVGLNWNLNAGGRISRITNGLVDDYISISSQGYKTIHSTDIIWVNSGSTGKTLKQLITDNINPPVHFDTQSEAIQYFDFLKDISDNKLDTQPDYFSFNALGISDHFVFDMANNEFVALDNPRIKVSAVSSGSNHNITSWTITNEDGTKFYFNKAERTKTTNDNSSATIIQEFNSSWLLTKIESPNLTDVYEFEYEDFNGVLITNQPLIPTTVARNEINSDNPNTQLTVHHQYTEFELTQQALTTIKHNGKIIIDISLKSRNDFNLNSAIDKIDVKTFNGSGIVKSFRLNHSYFGSSSSNAYTQRLKLDKIDIRSASTTLNSYEFEYFSPGSVPSRNSTGLDYLGLNNGAYSNSILAMYPEVTISGITFDGADRSPNFNNAKIGTLSKITYPTGGYSEFTYEPNKSTYTTNDINQSTQDVTKGTLTVSSGIGSSANCGACCLDQYGNPPNKNSVIFSITEAGTYDIDFHNDNGSFGEAYLFLRTPIVKPTPPPTLAYDEVIDQSSCNYLVNMEWSNFTGTDGDQIYLDVGMYQITLAKGENPYGSSSISLRVHREEVTTSNLPGTGQVERAGIRIKSIKDYATTGVLNSEKEYVYKTEVSGTDSSGELLFTPSYYAVDDYTIWSTEINAINNLVVGSNGRQQLRRSSSWSGGYRPHVAYNTVYELQKDGSSNNGYVRHDFNLDTSAGLFSTGVSPNVNLYFKEASTGQKMNTSVHKSDNTMLSNESTDYFNTTYFGESTMYIHNNSGKNYKYKRIYQSPDGKFRFDYVEALITGFVGTDNPKSYAPGGTTSAAMPSACNAPNHCMPLDYGTFETRQTYAQGNIGGILSIRKENVFGNDTIKQLTENSYDSAVDYLLRKSKTTNSLGDSLVNINYYTKDYSGTTVYDDMISKNRLSALIKSESFNNATKTATRETTYKKWSNSVYAPEFIKSAKASASLQNRIQFHSYYSNGNVKEVSMHNGPKTVYIWGHNNQYLVAKVENATHDQIEALAYFGTNFNIIGNLSTNQENSLRNNLPNAMVTTYNYSDPLIGVNSITDPKDYTTYFEYDQFNRLIRVKNDAGHIVSENTYHYKN